MGRLEIADVVKRSRMSGVNYFWWRGGGGPGYLSESWKFQCVLCSNMHFLAFKRLLSNYLG